MDRKHEILKAIVKHFVQTAEPVGSNTILVSYKFTVSPATIRNDMASLEKGGLVFQPHTSAGRVPTDLGYRLYIDEIAEKEAKQELKKIMKQYQTDRLREKIYDAVSLLARATNNVSFATLPDNKRTFYLGIANVLKQPEFVSNKIQASQVVEMLENDDRFRKTLESLDVNDTIKIFIGKENIISQIQSCSLMVTKFSRNGNEGFMGILGPTRMNYPFNRGVMEEIKVMLEND